MTPFLGDLRRQKLDIQKLLKSNLYNTISQNICHQKNGFLAVKFLLKDHKPEMPLRVVVNERASWQHLVSSFLRKPIQLAVPPSQRSLKNSDELLPMFLSLHKKPVTFFSLDFKDLYFSFDRQLLLSRTQVALENKHHLIAKEVSMSPSSLVELLDLYLRSTVIDFQDSMYVQKSGICIGSQLAPFLTNIYLNHFDNNATSMVSNNSSIYVLERYVDDVLVIGDVSIDVRSIISEITSAAPEMQFTEEVGGEVLQFLDMCLSKSSSGGLCWKYGKKTPKALLPAHSHHSKSVKNSVMESLITNAVRKCCFHNIDASLCTQVRRLCDAGYARERIANAISRVVAKVTHPIEAIKEEPRGNATVPYIHNVSHQLKKLAGKNNVRIRFSVPRKLAQLTPFTSSSSRVVCGIAHQARGKFIECHKNCVYAIPLSCGKQYVGQTSRCVNERLQQHNRNVKNRRQAKNKDVNVSSSEPNDDCSSELVKHVLLCPGCEPQFSGTTILHNNISDGYERVILESWEMHLASNAISQPSIVLPLSAIRLLQ
jgi:hypothetical protein